MQKQEALQVDDRRAKLDGAKWLLLIAGSALVIASWLLLIGANFYMGKLSFAGPLLLSVGMALFLIPSDEVLKSQTLSVKNNVSWT
jgi:hypothetical protein